MNITWPTWIWSGCIIMLVDTNRGTSFGKPRVHYFNVYKQMALFQVSSQSAPKFESSTSTCNVILSTCKLKACFYSYLKSGYAWINTCSSKFEGISKSDPEALVSSSIASCKSCYIFQMNYDFKKVYEHICFLNNEY